MVFAKHVKEQLSHLKHNDKLSKYQNGLSSKIYPPQLKSLYYPWIRAEVTMQDAWVHT